MKKNASDYSIYKDFVKFATETEITFAMDEKIIEILETELKPSDLENKNGGSTIGLPANYADTEETRFLLTPEACGMLTSSGLNLIMEAGAGVDISFSDMAYAEYGVNITSREESLKCDVVVSFAPLNAADVAKMRRGATLLCMMGDELFKADTIKALLDNEITLGCLDNMYSLNNEPVFADIINEIDGRAAIMYAQDHLSFLGGGKGVLLAGVAGINPCEVLLIGRGTTINAAASAAIASGAIVTLINNDVSDLAYSQRICGPSLITLAVHPRVLYNKAKSADVLIIGETTRPFTFPNKLTRAMKDTAFMLNFKDSHPSVSVPRTVAMALSNVLVNFMQEMIIKNGFEGMLMSTDGVQSGIVTYRGRLCDKLIGSFLSLPSVDIKMMLAVKN